MKGILLLQRSADFARHLFDVAEIELTAAQARSANTHEGNVRCEHGSVGIGSGVQPARLVGRCDQLLHPSFNDWCTAGIKHIDLGLADVNTGDLMAHVRKASGAHGSHVTKTKKADRRTHKVSLNRNEISDQLLKQNNSIVQQFGLPSKAPRWPVTDRLHGGYVQCNRSRGPLRRPNVCTCETQTSIAKVKF